MHSTGTCQSLRIVLEMSSGTCGRRCSVRQRLWPSPLGIVKYNYIQQLLKIIHFLVVLLLEVGDTLEFVWRLPPLSGRVGFRSQSKGTAPRSFVGVHTCRTEHAVARTQMRKRVYHEKCAELSCHTLSTNTPLLCISDSGKGVVGCHVVFSKRGFTRLPVFIITVKEVLCPSAHRESIKLSRLAQHGLWLGPWRTLYIYI